MAPTTNVITPTDISAILLISPNLLMIPIEAPNASIAIPSAVAAPMVCSAGNCPTKYSIPPNAATASVITRIDGTDFSALEPIFSIKANIPINTPRHAVDIASFLLPSIDKAATAIAITAIAAVIAIIFPLHSLAPLVAHIIKAIIAPNTLTAVTPFIRFSTGIIPKTTAIPARIPTATDTANMVVPILSIPPICDISVNARTNVMNPKANFPAFINSSVDNLLASLTTPTIRSIEKDIPAKVAPILVMPPILEIIAIARTNVMNPPIKYKDPVNSSCVSWLANLTTPTIRPIAIVIPISELPNPFNDPLVVVTIKPKYFTKAIKPIANTTPSTISSGFSIPTSFITPTISTIAYAILIIIPPNLLTVFSLSPVIAFPHVYMKIIIADMVPVRYIKPCSACLGSNCPIAFTAIAIARTAVAIAKRLDFNPLTFTPFPLILTDAAAIFSVANASIPRATDSAVIIPIAVHKLLLLSLS